MPKGLIYILVILLIALLIPPALIAATRTTEKKKPRVHYIQDMDNQHRFEMQQVSPYVEGEHGERNYLFNDQRIMRPPVEGSVARGELDVDEHYTKGLAGGAWADTFPPRIDMNEAMIRRGQDRFNIYCTPCHGGAGYGDGIVHVRAMKLVTAGVNGTTWVAPKSLHEAAIREQPLGQTFNTITNGVRTMPPYGDQIPVADRWAIVAFVKALQRSQHAEPGDLPSGIDVNRLPLDELTQAEIEAAAAQPTAAEQEAQQRESQQQEQAQDSEDAAQTENQP